MRNFFLVGLLVFLGTHAQAASMRAICHVYTGTHVQDPYVRLEKTVDLDNMNPGHEPTVTFGDYMVELGSPARVAEQNHSSRSRWVWQIRVYDLRGRFGGRDMVFYGDFSGYASFDLRKEILTKNLGTNEYMLAFSCESFDLP